MCIVLVIINFVLTQKQTVKLKQFNKKVLIYLRVKKVP